MKRTYQPSKLVRKRRHGFRARMATNGRPQGGGRAPRARTQAAQCLTSAAARLASPMERLRKRADFLAAADRRQGADRGVSSCRRGNAPKSGPVRVGFTVSKKVGNAVERNRVRRRLKEIVRLSAATGLSSGP